MNLMAASGLRFEESVNCWNLLIKLSREGELSDYYNASRQVLEHFRFKNVFVRRTKKAFISFVCEDLIEQICKSSPLFTGAIMKRLGRKHMKRRFGDIRELHGSLLTKTHAQPEIDFLHGRVSTGVFMKNYFNPARISDLQTRTLRAAGEIVAKIS